MVESTRETIGRNGTGHASVERRYYISSLPATAALLGKAVRAHCRIENSMHWLLDVAFRDDDCRIRTGEAAQNFAVLRRIALNLLKNDKLPKLGVASKRLKARWNVNYLSKLLGGCRADASCDCPVHAVLGESINNAMLVSLKQVTMLQIWLLNTGQPHDCPCAPCLASDKRSEVRR